MGVIEWALLMNGVIEHAWLKKDVKPIEINIVSLIFADFAAGAVLITFGGIVGKVSPLQLIVIALFEIVFYNVNEKIGVLDFEAVDVGGSMFVHTFGAYFGLAVAWVLGRGRSLRLANHPDNGSNKVSDQFAMIGTLFLWMFWPSFNGALATESQKHRVVCNTVISLSACCVTSFVFSAALRPGWKFDMVDIQNASLAGGVAVGSSADLVIEPWGAALIGTLAAVLSVFGYTMVNPLLEKIGCFDTCGIHNLHGMPGVMGGLGGVIAALVADDASYDGKEKVENIWAARAAENGKSGRSAEEQAQYQCAALAVTLVLAIVGGLITGCVAKAVQHVDPMEFEFLDNLYWHSGEQGIGLNRNVTMEWDEEVVDDENKAGVADSSGQKA